LIEEETVKYIDFDLDYRVPDAKLSRINLLDVDEFQENLIKFKYPPELVNKINLVKHDVLERFKRKEFDKYLNYDLIYSQANKTKNG
jgi:protein associated with RNAse G/E